MSAKSLLDRLLTSGISLEAQAGQLRVTAGRTAFLPALRQEIAENKGELLQLLSRSEASSGPTRARQEAALSLFQKRLWILQRLDPASTAFNITVVWTLDGRWDVKRAVAALRNTLARHEILRTRIRDEDGNPKIDVGDADAVEIRCQDLSGLSEDDCNGAIMGAARREVLRPFDLTTTPPVRFRVFDAGAGTVTLVPTMHHIGVDEWSMDLLRREIEGFDPAAVATPAVQYLDYARWEAENAKAGAEDLDWWETRLRGLPQRCAFEPDREVAPADAGSTFDFRLEPEVLEPLKRLVQKQGATVYMGLLAACAIVLRAHSTQDDIVIGSPMGVRERREFESVIGPFVNLLILRLDLSDDPSFAELLRRARGTVLDAHEHRAAPFELIVKRLNPPRTFRHAPLFQVAVVLHGASEGERGPSLAGGSVNDFTWFAHESAGGLDCTIEFRADLYSAVLIARIAAHLEAALKAAVASPAAPVGSLQILPEDEVRQLLGDFACSRTTQPSEPFITAFERRAAVAPDRPALTFEDVQWTYGALDHRARCIARSLQACGVPQGALVGVLLERGPDLVAALLGVQKAGCAYLPLDGGFPQKRLELMLDDSGCRAVIVDAGTAHLVAGRNSLTVLDLSEDAAAPPEVGGAPLDHVPGPDDLAYVIYTSGSTGRPNGVRITHGALSNFLASMAREPGLSEDDILAAVTTVSFDIAGLELYLPLLVGARIDLASHATASDGELLSRRLAETGATVIQATPATYRMLIDAGWSGSSGLRAFCGGEGLPPALAETLLPRVEALWNLYGPTETTIWSSLGRVAPGRPIDIGRPIDNTRIYVLDRARKLAPLGVSGEIWIAGAGVAPGYHDRPVLTEERFAVDPFCEGGGLMYKTGDLGRWTPEGRLTCIGRIDHQVKIRGFRIELGEIETMLAAHPKIREAHVLARGSAEGEQRLVAYLLLEEDEDLTPSEGRRFLRQRLPDYMIPSLFVPLDAVPRTPNGKVDRAALPDPFGDVRRMSDYRAPRPGLETAVAEIWRTVLGVQQVGADDNFFEIGGYSLLALRVAAAVRERTGWQMDPRTLFFQTLSQIATVCERETRATQ